MSILSEGDKPSFFIETNLPFNLLNKYNNKLVVDRSNIYKYNNNMKQRGMVTCQVINLLT